jgi:hypothetical protein
MIFALLFLTGCATHSPELEKQAEAEGVAKDAAKC